MTELEKEIKIHQKMVKPYRIFLEMIILLVIFAASIMIITMLYQMQ